MRASAAAQPGEDELPDACRNHADDDEDGCKPQAEDEHGRKPENTRADIFWPQTKAGIRPRILDGCSKG